MPPAGGRQRRSAPRRGCASPAAAGLVVLPGERLSRAGRPCRPSSASGRGRRSGRARGDADVSDETSRMVADGVAGVAVAVVVAAGARTRRSRRATSSPEMARHERRTEPERRAPVRGEVPSCPSTRLRLGVGQPDRRDRGAEVAPAVGASSGQAARGGGRRRARGARVPARRASPAGWRCRGGARDPATRHRDRP